MTEPKRRSQKPKKKADRTISEEDEQEGVAHEQFFNTSQGNILRNLAIYKI